MKKFLLNSILFLFSTASLLVLSSSLLIILDLYKKTVAGNEIYRSIEKSKQKSKSKIIIIGDSVGYQLFPNTAKNDSINSLACNSQISMVGQFILLNNYINEGNKFDKVFLIFTPTSFSNNLNSLQTYHYFLKPFYTDENKPLFNSNVNEQIKKIPYYNFCRFSNILASDWAPSSIPEDTVKFSFLSPISIDYLIEIKKLSIKNNFKLIILPAPICLSKKPIIENIFKKEKINVELENHFKNYFDNILYLNDTIFVDGIHFKKSNSYQQFYNKYYRDNLLK